MTELFFDTETSGVVDWHLPYTHERQPYPVQVAAVLSTEERVTGVMNLLVYPHNDRTIPEGATAIHGWSTQDCMVAGVSEDLVAKVFSDLAMSADVLVAHNIDFDLVVMKTLFHRCGYPALVDDLVLKPTCCTMKSSTDFCKLPGTRRGGSSYKWPKLAELHLVLFGEEMVGAHDALADVLAMRRCYYEMARRGLVTLPA